MKMQDVITRMREDVPLLVQRKEDVEAGYHAVRELITDYAGTRSELGREAIADRLRPELDKLDEGLTRLFAFVERLDCLNHGYTRKLGPKQRKDDPRQDDPPGFKTPSFETSGRHG